MRHREEREFPAHRDTIVVKVTCDRCGKVARTPSAYEPDWNTSDDHYDYVHTNVVIERGSAYPEGRIGRREFVDLCPECMEWLFQTLRGEGSTIHEEHFG